MRWGVDVPGLARGARRGARSDRHPAGAWWLGLLLVGLLGLLPGWAESPAPASGEVARGGRAFSYLHDRDSSVPWSIHVLRVELGDPRFTFHTTLGNGDQFGMATVPDQVRAFPPASGTPVGAINGDFYENQEHYTGRPRDLQILRGELVSGPSGHPCFWLDADGRPHLDEIEARFRVAWPDGTVTPVGLNAVRPADQAMLYTAAVGASTHTTGGMDIVLERDPSADPGQAWLPLAAGTTLRARVRDVRPSGDAPLAADVLVLSIGETLLPRVPPAAAGQVLRILLETVPDLTGVQVAIGGGPTLVREGRAREWSGLQLRHPRSALGWNADTLFLVEVDGRQAGLSAGMSFPELAGYMLKLGCHTAVNLDGGGSATLWVLGNVMNSPSEGRARPAANALVLVEKGGTTAHD